MAKRLSGQMKLTEAFKHLPTGHKVGVVAAGLAVVGGAVYLGSKFFMGRGKEEDKSFVDAEMQRRANGGKGAALGASPA